MRCINVPFNREGKRGESGVGERVGERVGEGRGKYAGSLWKRIALFIYAIN